MDRSLSRCARYSAAGEIVVYLWTEIYDFIGSIIHVGGKEETTLKLILIHINILFFTTK